MSSAPTLFDFLEDEMTSAEERAAFHMRLRGRGIQDLAVLRTLELVPRALFVPHRFKDLAQKDVSLPIGCGQTISEPWLVARMMEALDLAKHHKVLEVGSGSGYTAAILGQLAEEVISVERFQSLATEARARLGQMGLDNVGIVWGDGLCLPRQLGAFDRIFIEGRLDDPAHFIDFLNDDGVLIYGRSDPEMKHAQQLIRVTKNGETIEQSSVATCRLQSMVPGLSQAL